ncbi:MAG TPA: GAF domain-containing protein [Polyangiaceae bacterium]
MELRTALEQVGPDFDQFLRIILTHFRAQIGTIHTLGPDGMLHMRAHTPGIPEQVLAVTQVIPVGKGIAGLAVERKAPVNMCNLQKDKSGDARPGAAATGAMGSLCVPVMAGDQALGALGIASIGEREFTEAEVEQLVEAGKLLAGHIAKGSP